MTKRRTLAAIGCALKWTTLAGVMCAGLGCTVDRSTLPPEELEARAKAYEIANAAETAAGLEKLCRRLARERKLFEEGKTLGQPALDVLVISGGGDRGAFGAGFLAGWGMVDEGRTRRPLFDVVTGVSTGALIAPFAFVGSDPAYEKVLSLYRDPKKDWVQLRDLFFFLPGRKSFLTTKGLERDIRAQMDAEFIKDVAKGYEDDRLLLIGTTNLDLGVMQTWDLGQIAANPDHAPEHDRFYNVLLASSAIPAAFPPVVIDDTLYVDGGATSNIVVNLDPRNPYSLLNTWKQEHPHAALPTVRFWLIINNQLASEPQRVQPSWVSITKSSLATSIRSSTISTMKLLNLQCELLRRDAGMDVEFRYVAIPDNWRAPKEGVFEKETMENLALLGLTMGADPNSWKTELHEE